MQKKVEKRSTKGIDSRTCYGNEIDVDMAEKRRKKGGRGEMRPPMTVMVMRAAVMTTMTT